MNGETTDPGSGADLAIATHDCWTLLRAVTVGRLVVPDPELIIRPVNFVVVDERIVVRSDWSVPHGVGVLFEVDSIDESAKQGWSVIAQGHAQAIQADDLPRSVLDLLDPWAPGDKRVVLVVDVDRVTGRWVRSGRRPDAFDARGYL